jgi:hypothetical protein
MTGHRPIFDGRWTLTDRHGTDDPPMNVSLLGVVPGPTHAAGAPQVLQEFLLQGATRLDEEAAVDGLV